MQWSASRRSSLLLMSLLGALLVMAQPATAQLAAPAKPQPAVASPAAQLANAGQFDQLLASLKESGPSNTRVAALISDLERFQAHTQTWGTQRQQAYDKAMTLMVERTGAGHVEAALASAIEAHALASDQPAMLKLPQTQALVQLALKTAKEVEAQGDWIESLSIYRSLDLLFDDYATYREQVRRTERHARLLRLYAPSEFKRLFDERVKRMKKAQDQAEKAKEAIEDKKKDKDADAMEPDEEKWQSKLDGVKWSMLRPVLEKSAREHVSNPGYGPLLRGAINGLVVLSETGPLAGTFPGLNNPDKLKLLRDGLAALRREVEVQEKVGMNVLDATGILDRVRELNTRTVALPDQVLIYELADGAVSVLDDFTSVIWPQEMDTFSRATQGEFFGVGIQISRRDGQLICVSPLEDTPAQRAGIKAGDAIVAVDGRDPSAWSLDFAVRQITGPLGTPVTLTIQRPGQPGQLEFKLTRAKIAIESIKGWSRRTQGGWDYYIDPIERIGYVRLAQFIPQSAQDLDVAINQMEQAGGVRGLILDLRFNPGGLLQSATEISNRFVPEGLLVDTVDKDGRVSDARRARPQYSYKSNIPVVVLVNQGSASASEIVSGVLQDYNRAMVVGTRSFGKGSVQDLLRIDSGDKAYLKLTTHYYRLPKGRIIHRKPDAKTWGIEPDLKIEMTDQQVVDALEHRQKADILRTKEELGDPNNPVPTAAQLIEKALDPQLEAALLVLKTRLVSPALAPVQKAEAPAAVTR